MTTALLSCGFGLLLLYLGAEALVRGGSNLGLKLGLSPLVVGLTIVAFGTSAPELAVSVNAVLDNKTDVAVGNVVGSNIANIGLILGVSALVRPLSINVRLIRTDIPVLIGVSLLFCLLMGNGVVSRFDGLILFTGIIVFIVFSIIAARRSQPETQNLYAEQLEEELHPAPRPWWLDTGMVIGGLVLLVVGGRFMVDGAVQIARLAGLSEAVIGLTIIAVGTSLPEMATSILAAAKKMGDISAGNIIGSNIFNLLGILGTSALLAPLPLGNVTWVDIGMLLIVAVAVLPLARTGFVLKRWEGALFLTGYAAYIGWLISTT